MAPRPAPEQHPDKFTSASHIASAKRLTQHLRRQLEKKQEEHAHNIAEVLGAIDPKKQRAAQAAVRRNEKSLALLVKKVLCPHQIRHSVMNRYGAQVEHVYCLLCKGDMKR